MASGDATDGLTGVRRYRRRSDLYRWLRDHSQDVAETLMRDQPAWRSVADYLAGIGVVNTKGAAPSADSVRRVWRTVCRDLARAEAERIRRNVLGQNPSRIPAAWRPSPVPAVPVRPGASPPAPATNPTSNGAAAPEPGMNVDPADQMIERLRQKLRDRTY